MDRLKKKFFGDKTALKKNPLNKFLGHNSADSKIPADDSQANKISEDKTTQTDKILEDHTPVVKSGNHAPENKKTKEDQPLVNKVAAENVVSGTTPQQSNLNGPNNTGMASKLGHTKQEKEKEKQEKARLPTKFQFEKWSSSINALLEDPEGVESFRNYLKCLEEESGDEEGQHTRYIDFYVECAKYKADFKRLEDNAKEIFEVYLEDADHLAIVFQIGAEKEVGTRGKGVQIGDKLEEEGLEGVTLFDEPMMSVKKKLSEERYGNYCSRMKEMLKL